MGLFDVFKGDSAQAMTPKMALGASLLYMMSADGNVEQEEIGQLVSVLGGDRAAFTPAGYVTLPGWSYRNMWWVTHNEHGAYMARGIHGQAIYVDPTAEMVIARYASHPLAANANNDPTSLPAYHALARHLMGATR